MYDPCVMSNGLASVLVAKWTLQCETPLVLQMGRSFYYEKPEQHTKERKSDLTFHWNRHDRGNSAQHGMAALAYRWVVEGDTARMVHQTPASAVRGVLRNWTLQHLVNAADLPNLLAPEGETKEEAQQRIAALKTALDGDASGLPLAASLFGLALDTRNDEADISHVGRLRVETAPFCDEDAHMIAVSGHPAEIVGGPDNAKRHMAVRTPLDRVTHAVSGSGLHHWIEFSRGATFDVTLRIANATPADAGLLSVWAREIDDGMLRLGALSSIGRGRMTVQDPEYTLWARRGRNFPAIWSDFWAHQDSQDPLTGLYLAFDLSEHLSSCESKVTEGWNHA